MALATALLFVASALQGAPIFVVQYTLDEVLIARDASRLGWLAPGVVLLYVLNGAVGLARGLLTRSVAWRVVTDLRQDLYVHLLHLDPAWHQRVPTGERVNRLVGDVNNLQYAVSGVVTAIQKPVTLACLAGSAIWLNPTLAVLALALLPAVGWPIARFGRWVRAASALALEAGARLSALAQESFAGVRVVQLFTAEAERAARFARLNRAHEAAQVQALTAQLLPPPVTEVLASLGVGLVLWVGGRQVVAGTLAPGELVAFLVALAAMNQPLRGLSEVNALLQRSLAAAERVFALFDTSSTLAGGTAAPGPFAALRFEGVTVDFGDGPVLDEVSFELAAGRRVAVVGPSGAGKSTLLGLVARLADPTAGRVTWNGVDLRALDLPALRRGIAVVSQETFLFDATVAENIALGAPAATRAEIEAAARVANAEGFIQELPQGYDTPLLEGGMRLSGGQRQRICIARAVLRGAPLLVLDEATSNLDRESERLVQEALDRLMVGRATLVVTHRLASIAEVDHVVVLEAGRVVEQGPPEGLRAQGGAFARMASGARPA